MNRSLAGLFLAGVLPGLAQIACTASGGPAQPSGMTPPDSGSAPSATNGGGVPQPPGTTTTPSDALSLRNYAAGDGVTDDTAAINAAFAKAPAGGTVIAPAATYRLSGSGVSISKSLTLQMDQGATFVTAGTSAIVVNNASGVVIRGGSILLQTNPTAAQFGITSQGTVTGLTVEGVTITGQGTAGDVAHGVQTAFGNISGQALSNVNVLRCTISAVNVGISLNADSAGSISGALVEGNTISKVVGTQSGQGYGVHHANGSGDCSYARIIGNHIEGAQRHSIYQARGCGVTIAHNTIKDHRAGVALGSPRPAIVVARSTDVTVEGNVIINPTDGAITVTPGEGVLTGNVTIVGNVIKNWQAYPAMPIGSQDPVKEGVVKNVIIASNHFSNDLAVTRASGGASMALDILSGFHVTVANNSFEMLNANTTSHVVLIPGTAEGALTANYTNDVRFVANQMWITGAAGYGFTLDVPMCGAASRLEFYNNRIAGAAAMFYRLAAQTNPNIYVVGEYDGLDERLIHPIPGALIATEPVQALPFGISPLALDASRSDEWVLSASANVPHVIAAPIKGAIGQRITIMIRNASGGPLTATPDPFESAAFRKGSWTQPGNGFSRSITFRYDGSAWVEVSRTLYDVPN